MELILITFGGIAGLALGWFIGRLLGIGQAGRNWSRGLRLGLLIAAAAVGFGRGSLVGAVTILAVGAGISVAGPRRVGRRERRRRPR